MELASSAENKDTYTHLHDDIITKRLHSPYKLRRYCHRRQWQIFLDLIPEGSTVLDAGCGDGVLSVMLAQKGCTVTGVDISEPNIEAARQFAQAQGVADKITFMTGDIEHLPVEDASHEYVVSSHVLEHIPDFTKGAAELARCAQKQVLVAIPTCLNPCSMTLLGGDSYWVLSRHSLYAWLLGFLKVCWSLLTGQDGVHEGYEGHGELVHISRFPWRGKQSLEQGGLKVERYCASRLTVAPYLDILVPLARVLESVAWLPLIRNFGHGTTYVCLKK